MDKENINTASVTKVPEPEPLPINSNVSTPSPVTRRPPLMTLYQIPSQASSSTGQSDLTKRVGDWKHFTLRPDRQSEESVTCETQSSGLGKTLLHLLSSEKSIKYVPKPELGEMARARVINWIIRAHEELGEPEIVQTAVWYLDYLLNQCNIPIEKLKVTAAVVCWIAQKECGHDTMSAKKLVTLSRKAFNLRQLADEKRNVVIKLGYMPRPVIPQDFIAYLALWCDCDDFRQIEHAANFICMTGLMVDEKLCEEYPSVLAGAAVKDALQLLGMVDQLPVLQICPLYRNIVKKTTRMASVISTFRAAVLTMVDLSYTCKALMDFFGGPPYETSEKIILAIQHAHMN